MSTRRLPVARPQIVRKNQGFTGTLVSDDFSGYHALYALGVKAALCMAHARRKLFEAYKLNASTIDGQAVALIAKLYEVEREARELDAHERWRLRQQHAKPVADALHTWLIEQRQRLVNADATAKAIDYSLSNWRALTRYLDDGNVPIESAKLNGQDPWAYLKDVFERLPTLKQRDLAQLLPHNWRPADQANQTAAPAPEPGPAAA
jgi:transposase